MIAPAESPDPEEAKDNAAVNNVLIVMARCRGIGIGVVELVIQIEGWPRHRNRVDEDLIISAETLCPGIEIEAPPGPVDIISERIIVVELRGQCQYPFVSDARSDGDAVGRG